MTSAMGYFDGLGTTAAAVQYDGTVYGAQRLQDWVLEDELPPDYEQDEVRNNTATLFIFNNPFQIEPTDWLVHTIDGDWLIFDDDNMQDLFEYVEEHEAT
jgi:hypothetical protein